MVVSPFGCWPVGLWSIGWKAVVAPLGRNAWRTLKALQFRPADTLAPKQVNERRRPPAALFVAPSVRSPSPASFKASYKAVLPTLTAAAACGRSALSAISLRALSSLAGVPPACARRGGLGRCGGQPGLGSFPYQVTLELGKRGESVKQQFAVSGRGVNSRVSQRAERYAALAQLVHGLHQMGKRTAKPVDLPHYKRIAFAQVCEGFLGPAGPPWPRWPRR